MANVFFHKWLVNSILHMKRLSNNDQLLIVLLRNFFSIIKTISKLQSYLKKRTGH